MDADRAADPRGNRTVHRHATARATAGSSTPHTASRSSCCSTCRSDDPIKISRLTITNHSARPRRLSVTAYVEWVLGASRAASAPFVVTEIDPQTGAMFARNPWSTEFGTRVAFADLGRAPDSLDRRPDGIPGPQRHARSSRRARASARRSRIGSVAGSIPAARCKPRLELAPDAAVEIVFFLGEAATQRGRQLAGHAIPRRRSRRGLRACDRATGTTSSARTGEDARPRDGHPAQSLAALPDARLPRVGARRLSTRRAAPTAFAISCRTSWRSPSRSRRSRAHICCARPRGNSSKATCSIGGCRRRATACARASPTIALWLPYAAAALRRGHRRPRRPRRSRAVSRRAARCGRRARSVLPADGLARQRDAVRALRARPRPQPRRRRARPAADRHRRLERRHEPRRRRQGKGESVWLGWFLHATLVARSPRSRDRRGEQARARRWRQHAAALGQSLERDGWDGDWYRRALLRRRHAARARRRATSAASTPSRSRGRDLRAPPTRARARTRHGGRRANT